MFGFGKTYTLHSPEVQAAIQRVANKARRLPYNQTVREDVTREITVSGSRHEHNDQVYVLVWKFPKSYPQQEQERWFQDYI